MSERESTSEAGRTPPPIAVWASRWPPNQKPRDGFCRAAVFGERVTEWQCQRKAKRAVAGCDFCEQHAREAEIKLGTREPVKRPPTKFEREIAQMEAKRDRDKALLAERDRLASELAAMTAERDALRAFLMDLRNALKPWGAAELTRSIDERLK
jgi:hypothetical protein